MERTIWRELNDIQPISTFVGGINVNPTVDRLSKLRAQVNEKHDKLDSLHTALDSLEVDAPKKTEDIQKFKMLNDEIASADVHNADRMIKKAANEFVSQLTDRNTKLGSINYSANMDKLNRENAIKSKSDVALAKADMIKDLYSKSGGVKPIDENNPNGYYTGHLEQVDFAEPKSPIETANKVMSGWHPDKKGYKNFALPGGEYINPQTGKKEQVPEGQVVVNYGNSIEKINTKEVIPSLVKAFEEDNKNYLLDKYQVEYYQELKNNGEFDNYVKQLGRDETKKLILQEANKRTQQRILDDAKEFANKIGFTNEEYDASIQHLNQFGEGGTDNSRGDLGVHSMSDEVTVNPNLQKIPNKLNANEKDGYLKTPALLELENKYNEWKNNPENKNKTLPKEFEGVKEISEGKGLKNPYGLHESLKPYWTKTTTDKLTNLQIQNQDNPIYQQTLKSLGYDNLSLDKLQPKEKEKIYNEITKNYEELYKTYDTIPNSFLAFPSDLQKDVKNMYFGEDGGGSIIRNSEVTDTKGNKIELPDATTMKKENEKNQISGFDPIKVKFIGQVNGKKAYIEPTDTIKQHFGVLKVFNDFLYDPNSTEANLSNPISIGGYVFDGKFKKDIVKNGNKFDIQGYIETSQGDIIPLKDLIQLTIDTSNLNQTQDNSRTPSLSKYKKYKN